MNDTAKQHRILWNGEASFNKSGYSKGSKEILTRLHSTGKYCVAELASYASPDDVANCNSPWKIYPVQPNPHNAEELKEYNAHSANQCGRHKFNHVCLDFLPSVCCDMRDFWYKEYEHISPFRPYYNLIWINPVDGAPQDNKWIADTIDCDAVMTYTDWGKDVLERQCGTKGNIAGVFPLGVNTNDFYPIWNRAAIKQYFGMQDDTLVIGFVARNQYRKLFDDLLQAFTHFLQNAPSDIAERTYLYLHSCWPDIGTKFPQILMEYGIGHKVLFTYFCKNCKQIFSSTYADSRTICKHCNQFSAILPKPNDELNEEQLNLIYNFFDVYVQVASNEGIGIPGIEAMCCGIPTMVINHTGMTDLVNKGGAIPIECSSLRREMELHRMLAVPDINDLTSKLIEILSLPYSLRRKIGFEQHQKCLKEFNWDIGVHRLMNIIDNMPIKNWADKHPRIHNPQLPVPENISHEQFVYYLCNNIMGRAETFDNYASMLKIQNLTMGWCGNKEQLRAYDRNTALQDAMGDINWYNEWEKKRLQKFKICQ